ncbi:hypothetical protein GpartN1_g3149.t1 [Galdieria partita]|uniref:Programmed cell death protein 2 C-terminal domain-containing protein n=1 Tax=Galdieria partita TaxID=83374 RepID=A0A9C7PUZ3_9RHOD|nr:hypothetical protein GpartN1_g3149.t1 [Galdieria partita]
MTIEDQAVLLGVPKRCQTTDFEKETCFLGGRPIWFGDGPEAHFLHCARCKSAERVVFLFQCPTSYEEGFDRFLYLFVCMKEGCLQNSDGWILLRSLVRTKPRYDALKVEEKQQFWEDFGTFEGSWNSKADNGAAEEICSEFEKKLVEDWRNLSLALTPKGEASSSTKYKDVERHSSINWNTEVPLPQISLEVVEEPQYEKEHKVDPHIQFLRAQFYQNVAGQMDEDFDIDGVSFFVEMQKEEWKYYKRIEQCPNQCVRYHFGGTPLITPSSKWNKRMMSKIPPCPCCNSERAFEFQLMSQFLYFLKESSKKSNMQISLLDDDHSFMSLSTILVYTCSKDCKTISEGTGISNTKYYREYVLPVFETCLPRRDLC